jgi:hypothetical protein
MHNFEVRCPFQLISHAQFKCCCLRIIRDFCCTYSRGRTYPQDSVKYTLQHFFHQLAILASWCLLNIQFWHNPRVQFSEIVPEVLLSCFKWYFVKDHLMLYILHKYLKCWNLQLSLQSWAGELSESFVVKRHADNAFKSKDFATAVECYSRVRYIMWWTHISLLSVLLVPF